MRAWNAVFVAGGGAVTATGAWIVLAVSRTGASTAVDGCPIGGLTCGIAGDLDAAGTIVTEPAVSTGLEPSGCSGCGAAGGSFWVVASGVCLAEVGSAASSSTRRAGDVTLGNGGGAVAEGLAWIVLELSVEEVSPLGEDC